MATVLHRRACRLRCCPTSQGEPGRDAAAQGTDAVLSAGFSADEIAAAVEQAATAFSAGVLHDDLAVLAVKVV